MKLMLGFFICISFLVGCSTQANKEKTEFGINTTEINYTYLGKNYVGYLATPKLKGKKDQKVPGVLVVHEWWGQTDYPRKRADEMSWKLMEDFLDKHL